MVTKIAEIVVQIALDLWIQLERLDISTKISLHLFLGFFFLNCSSFVVFDNLTSDFTLKRLFFHAITNGIFASISDYLLYIELPLFIYPLSMEFTLAVQSSLQTHFPTHC